jgi:CHAD domain-containing protein
MPFRFKKKESVAKAVRRLCCERLEDALEILETRVKFQAAHEVRKEIKKLRSVLRLMRREIGKKTYSKRAKTFREGATLLTAFRDAQVKVAAFERLAKHFRHKFPAGWFSEIERALQKNCRAEKKKLGRAIMSLKGILHDSKHQIGELKIDSKGWKAIAPGLKKIYGRGREALATARREPSPENFHEWRKRVKDLGYQLHLLCPARPRKLRRQAEHLEKLGDFLGDDHDLFMLGKFAADKFARAQNREAFEKLIESRQKRLRSAALKLGARFYREKPHHFCRRIGGYWKDWRG